MIKNTSTSSSEKNKTARFPQTEFDAILNSIPDVIIRFNLSGKVVWWNKNFEDVVSLSVERLLNSSFSDLFSLCDNSSIIDKTIHTGAAEAEAYLSSFDGRKRYHLKSSLIVDSLINADKENEVLIVGRDINDRFQMSDALKQSKAQLQKLIDSLPFFVFLTTADDEYLIANKEFCNFVGASSSEIIGFKNQDILNNGDMIEFLIRDNKKILSDQCSVHYEGSLNVNRSHINLSADKFPLFDEDNRIYAICGVIEDITAQCQLQRQLQQTQKMEAIGQLTGGIAHDFNNVLASILGYTGLTKKRISDYDDKTTISYLNQITRAGERARDLVQQLLAFSRGDVGGLQVLDPEPLAHEAIKMLTSLIPSSISLNFKIRSNNVKYHIEVDPIQFSQSLMNLVINAKDAIVDDIGHIDVSLDYLPQAKGLCDSCHTPFTGKFIKLTVKDNGTGIEQGIFNRIFDPFFTTKEVGKGSGMGMSMLHGIVHGSGGHIVITSMTKGANTGTTVDVYFPFVNLSNNQNNIEEKPTHYKYEKKHIAEIGKTILLIDDETLITDFLQASLKQEGYNIVTFNDSVKALDYFKNNNQVDIIISDQTMPELTGVELAKHIFNANYQIPFILCSGYTDFALDSHDKDTGIDVYLNKPFDQTLLLQHISRLLKLYQV